MVGAERVSITLLYNRSPRRGEISLLYAIPRRQRLLDTGIYREIKKPERIVCTDSFADEKGNVVPATYYGMSPDFPAEMLMTVTFEVHPV